MNNPSLNVLRPTASTLATSSYVSVPAIPTSPVTVRFPPMVALLVTFKFELTVAFPVTSIPAPTSKFCATVVVPSDATVNLFAPFVSSLTLNNPLLTLILKSLLWLVSVR